MFDTLASDFRITESDSSCREMSIEEAREFFDWLEANHLSIPSIELAPSGNLLVHWDYASLPPLPTRSVLAAAH